MDDLDQPTTDLRSAAAALDTELGALIAWLHTQADGLRAVERSVAAHPAGRRDDVESGNVWPDHDNDCATTTTAADHDNVTPGPFGKFFR